LKPRITLEDKRNDGFDYFKTAVCDFFKKKEYRKLSAQQRFFSFLPLGRLLMFQ